MVECEPDATIPHEPPIDSSKAKKVFLEERINYYIAEFRKKRDSNRLGALGVRGSIILAGAFTTILLGLKSSKSFTDSQEQMANAALVISALVTAVSAWESFVDYHTKWITYRATLYKFYCIKDDFDFAAQEVTFPTCEQAQSYYDRIEVAVRETDEKWLSSRLRASGAGSAPTIGSA